MEIKKEIETIFNQHFEVSQQFLKENIQALTQLVELIAKTFKEGNKLLIFGNGGSAADAQHLACEFVNRFLIDRPPLPAIALTTDSSILTSISNDYSYEEIFVRQVAALGKRGDIALGISTSGNSLNVIKGLKKAKALGLLTIGLTGKSGGEMAKLVDYNLNVALGSTPRIQEAHITVGHTIVDLVDRLLFG